MKEKVEAAIEKIRPMLQADGGDVELVDVQEGIVTVRLQGACAGCPISHRCHWSKPKVHPPC